MRSQSTLAASMALLGAASARIVGIAAPSQIAPGVAFPITIITEDYIQTVTDIAAAFGLAQPVTADQCSLGTYLSTTTLGPEYSNIATNISTTATLPAAQPLGPAQLTASIFSLYGAGADAELTDYILDITVANATSSDLVSTEAATCNNGAAVSPVAVTPVTTSVIIPVTTVIPVSPSSGFPGVTTNISTTLSVVVPITETVPVIVSSVPAPTANATTSGFGVGPVSGSALPSTLIYSTGVPVVSPISGSPVPIVNATTSGLNVGPISGSPLPTLNSTSVVAVTIPVTETISGFGVGPVSGSPLPIANSTTVVAVTVPVTQSVPSSVSAGPIPIANATTSGFGVGPISGSPLPSANSTVIIAVTIPVTQSIPVGISGSPLPISNVTTTLNVTVPITQTVPVVSAISGTPITIANVTTTINATIPVTETLVTPASSIVAPISGSPIPILNSTTLVLATATITEALPTVTPVSTPSTTTTTPSSLTTSSTSTSVTYPAATAAAIQSEILQAQTAMNALLQDFVDDGTAAQNNTKTAADYQAARALLREIFALVVPDSTCEDQAVAAAPTTADDAINLAQSVQLTLNSLSLDILDSDSATAKLDFCSANANFDSIAAFAGTTS